MSTQKGNASRTRPQKHKNRTVFKNNLHDTSGRTKLINSIQVSDVCVRCKDIIEWKIKYKKYKPLTQPKKCVKCEQKTVKKAYHVMCYECGKKLKVCTKCCESKEIIEAPPSEKEQLQLDNEMRNLLQSLPERQRRSFIRYMNKKKEEPEGGASKDQLMERLNQLKLKNGDDDDDDDNEFWIDGEGDDDDGEGDDDNDDDEK